MAFSLFDATVANYLQTLGALAGILERSRAHFAEAGVALEEIVEARLAGDMLPFRFQVVSATHHSLGAIEGVKRGLFQPPKGNTDLDFAALQALVTQARDALGAFGRDDINALEGGDVTFQIGERRVPFKAEDFLMSFSLPNFYFHAATSYDLLRMKGAPLGKKDYLGRMRIKS
jgi:hypothetical protein